MEKIFIIYNFKISRVIQIELFLKFKFSSNICTDIVENLQWNFNSCHRGWMAQPILLFCRTCFGKVTEEHASFAWQNRRIYITFMILNVRYLERRITYNWPMWTKIYGHLIKRQDEMRLDSSEYQVIIGIFIVSDKALSEFFEETHKFFIHRCQLCNNKLLLPFSISFVCS